MNVTSFLADKKNMLLRFRYKKAILFGLANILMINLVRRFISK